MSSQSACHRRDFNVRKAKNQGLEGHASQSKRPEKPKNAYETKLWIITLALVVPGRGWYDDGTCRSVQMPKQRDAGFSFQVAARGMPDASLRTPFELGSRLASQANRLHVGALLLQFSNFVLKIDSSF